MTIATGQPILAADILSIQTLATGAVQASGGDGSAVSVLSTGGIAPRTLADRFSTVVNVKDFGARCDGVTDDTTAFRAAIAKALTSTDGAPVLSIPGGKTILSGSLVVALTGTQAITFQGAGSAETELIWTSDTDGIVVTLSGSQTWIRTPANPGQAVQLRGLSLVRGNVANGRTAFRVDGQNNANAGILSVVSSDVTIRGATGGNWAIGTNYIATGQTNTIGYYFHGPNGSNYGVGIQIDGGTGFSVDHSIAYPRIAAADTGIKIGLNVQGVQITQPTMVGVNYGVYWDGTGGTTRADLLSIQGSGHIGSAVTAAVFTNNVDTVQISGLYAIQGGTSWRGISMTNGVRANIIGNILLGSNAAAQIGVYVNNGATGTISGNDFVQFGAAGSFAIQLAGTTTGYAITGNALATVATLGSDAAGTSLWALNYGASADGIVQSIRKDTPGNLHLYAATNIMLDQATQVSGLLSPQAGLNVSGGPANVNGTTNSIAVAGSASGVPVNLQAFGGDPNIGINLITKAAGPVQINGATITPNLVGTSAAIGGGALAAGAAATGTVSVTGATVGMDVVVTPTTYPGDGVYWNGYVSAAGVVTIKVTAIVAVTPTSTAYNVRVVQ